MSSYSLTVNNKSGDMQQVAVYQDFPNLNGLSLVWFSKKINHDSSATFSWDISWALNWGTSEKQLQPGIMWSSGGTPVAVDPASKGEPNEMTISHTEGGFLSSPPINDPNVPLGCMQVITDSSFYVSDSINMSIVVCMNGSPSFAMQGKPNGNYLFDTHPTYYVCVTDHKVGVAVTGSFVSSPTKVVFAGSTKSLTYHLDGKLTFVLDPAI